MIGNKWTWITTIVLVPFVILWLIFSLTWALGLLGAVAVLLLLGVRGSDGHRRRDIPYNQETTGIGGQTASYSQFSQGSDNIYDPAYSHVLHYDPEAELEEDEDDDEAGRPIIIVFEAPSDNGQETQSRTPRGNGPDLKQAKKLHVASPLIDAEKDALRATQRRLKEDSNRTARRFRRLL